MVSGLRVPPRVSSLKIVHPRPFPSCAEWNNGKCRDLLIVIGCVHYKKMFVGDLRPIITKDWVPLHADSGLAGHVGIKQQRSYALTHLEGGCRVTISES